MSDSEPFDSDENASENGEGKESTKKRVLSDSGKNEKSEGVPKKKIRAMIELEAEESGDEEDQAEEFEQEELENEYVPDGFVVFNESDSEDNSNVTSKKPKKTLQRLKRAKPRFVEEEDLELLRDNQAREYSHSDEIIPESVRDEDKFEGELDTETPEVEKADLPNTSTIRKGHSNRYPSGYEEEYESDDIDFVVDDDDVNEDGGIREEPEDPEERLRKRREKVNRLKGSMSGGPLRDQLDEATALFGEGYEDYMGEEEEEDEDVFGEIAAEKEMKKLQLLRSRFERTTLVETFCTDMDEVIRNTDRPERMIEIMVGRQIPDAKERHDEAIWISEKLAEKIISNGDTYMGLDSLSSALFESVKSVLEFIQEEQREIPFIWTHRRDYLHPVLTRPYLWWIQTMDEKWENIVSKRNRILLELQYIEDVALTEGNHEQMTLAQRQERVSAKLATYQQALQELESAQEELEAANNLNDDDDDDDDDLGFKPTDSERIAVAEKRLNDVNEMLKVYKTDLEEEESLLADLVRAQKSTRATCSKEVALKFLELFPLARYRAMLLELKEDDEIRDFQHYFSVLFKGCVEECNEGNPTGLNSNQSARKKIRKGTAKDLYFSARNFPLRPFIHSFFGKISDIGDAMRFGPSLKVNPPTPPFGIGNIPNEYLLNFSSQEKLLDVVKSIVATELAAEPSVRRVLRTKFIETASISTLPTELGLENIHPFSEMFGLHYLKQKPIKDLIHGSSSDRYLFARLVRAKAEGLLELQINYPTIETPLGLRPNLEIFLNETGLLKIVLPNLPDDWNVIRMTILGEMLEKYLIPHYKEEIHRELLRLSVDTLVEECAINFRKLLSFGPFRPSDVTPAQILLKCPLRPAYPSVASIYIPPHSNETAFFLAFTDRDGVLRAHDLLPGEVRNQKKTKLRDFLKMTRPDVVAINTGAGQISQSTKMMIEKYILQEVRDLLEQELAKKRQEREDEMDYNRYEDEDEVIQFHPDVLLVHDEVARIFGESSRAKKLLPDFLPGAASAVCLCRYVQDPLTEYANMWSSADALGFFGYESLFLDLHPHKGLITKAKAPLLRALESCLVDAVCEVGVDINMAVSHDHLAGPLAFVGGLGLRKADALRHNIKTTLGCVSSRKELLERKLMGKVVYNNAASFLRVCDQGLEDKAVDFFDDTRIHPECYIQNDFAPKICATAMDMTHTENYQRTVETVAMLRKNCRRELELALKKPNSKFLTSWARNELLELPDKLSKLQLHEYAAELEAAGKGKRLRQFEGIVQEIRFPWLDTRPPLKEIELNQLFSHITGESDYSLFPGLRVGCKIIETRGNAANLVIDNGLRGFVRISNISSEKISDVSAVLRVGDTVNGVILRVLKDQFKVEVSLKPSDIEKTEDYWLSNRNTISHIMEWWEQVGRAPFDPYFKEDEALKAYQRNFKKRAEEAAKTIEGVLAVDTTIQSQSTGVQGFGRFVRKIYHPLFKNLNSKEAEDYLSGKGTGEIVVRPSSKDKDTLIITWAFQENWYKHIEVKEENKASGGDTLGQSLYISGESECFSDLDEISARFIAPMNDLVSQMTNYRSFRKGSKEDIDNWLNNELKARPNRIPYCIRLYEKQPGYFVLSWLLNVGHSIKSEIVAVRPEGYKMRDKVFGSPSELIQWFKSNATKKKEASSTSIKQDSTSSRIPPSIPAPPRSRPPPPPPRNVPGMPAKRTSRFSDAFP